MLQQTFCTFGNKHIIEGPVSFSRTISLHPFAFLQYLTQLNLQMLTSYTVTDVIWLAQCHRGLYVFHGLVGQKKKCCLL